MSRARTALLALVAPLVLTGVLATPPADAATRTTTYALPGAKTYPEGVTSYRDVFYVTSTTDGTLFRGTTGTRSLTVFKAPGTDGRTTAIGLEVTRAGDRLVVAGGDTGQVHVYDTRSGRLVARYDNGGTAATFLNDVAIAPNGDAYVTDSNRSVLYRVPAAQIARGTGSAAVAPLQVFRDFTGTAFRYGAGFNANGIFVTEDGRSVVLGQSSTGKLFRVVLATKKVTQVDLGGKTLVNADGLERRGDVLYAVRNANGVISKVKLAADGSRGTVYGQVSSPTFRYPTTTAFSGDQLLVVNSQFDVRSSGGTPKPFTVSGLTNP